DPAERAFVAKGEGPFAAFLARMGQAGQAAEGGRRPARSPVALVAPWLRESHLAVHCVDLDDDDRAALRASGATVVLCPRSNVCIGGRLPDLPALLAAGIPLAVGTDSLASCASLAPMTDLALLAKEFPGVPASTLMQLAWNGPAVGAANVGALVPGLAPGILSAPLTPTGGGASRLRSPSASDAAGFAVDRSRGASPPTPPGDFDPFDFLLRAHGAEGRPFHWIARNRAEA
ncbi:MAG TPA: amidohydrolase family protein, partial [Anaeromyxobacteraceae bacterium]|nr:amidohydrolase family protein [Anaeromyxobacteraceae bacterium]